MFRLQPDEVDNSLRIFLSVTSLFAQQPAPFNHLSHAFYLCLFDETRCVRCLQQAVREAATIGPRPGKLTFDLLTLKVVFELRVTWAISVPISVFL